MHAYVARRSAITCVQLGAGSSGTTRRSWASIASASSSCGDLGVPEASVLMTTAARPAGPSSSSRLEQPLPGLAVELQQWCGDPERNRILQVRGRDRLE